MSNFKVIKRESLTQAVNKQLGGLVSEKDVVITGARLIKDGRLELEFAQARKLRNSKTSVLALLNKGDDRFNLNNKQIVRVWHMITLEGAKEAFNLDFNDIAKTAEGIASDERIVVMMNIKKFFAEGEEFDLNIRVRETTDIAKLPKSMREDIENNTIYAENHILKAPTGINGELEPVVDENGKNVYRWNELDYIKPGANIDDELIQGKKPLSSYNAEGLSKKNESALTTPQNVNMAL